MVESRPQQEQELMLECPVCFETYEEEGDLAPHNLSCGHTTCLKCFLQMRGDAEMKSLETWQCPTCRKDQRVDAEPAKSFSFISLMPAFKQSNRKPLGDVTNLQHQE